MKRLTNIYLLFTLLMVAFLSCNQGEDSIVTPPPSIEIPGDGLFLSLDVLGSSSGTRAISSAGETAINDLYAIYFQTGAVTTTLDCTGYQKMGNPITVSNVNYYELIGYPTGSNVDIVFVANIESNGITPQASWKDKTFDEVSKLLFIEINKQDAANKDSVWASDKDVQKTQSIPMYVRAKNITIPTTITSGANYVKDNSSPVVKGNAQTYNLMRMVARMEIINYHAHTNMPADNEKFTIDSVWVANTHAKGYICFKDNAWDDTESRITTPSLWETTDKNVGSGRRVVYHKPNLPVTSNAQTIIFYLFETGVEEPGKDSSQKNCHIVLKGTKGTDTATLLSYMLPVPTLKTENSKLTADIETPGPVLRNYNYKYTVYGVPSTQEQTLTLTVQVVDWVKARIPITLWGED